MRIHPYETCGMEPMLPYEILRLLFTIEHPTRESTSKLVP